MGEHQGEFLQSITVSFHSYPIHRTSVVCVRLRHKIPLILDNGNKDRYTEGIRSRGSDNIAKCSPEDMFHHSHTILFVMYAKGIKN